MCSAAQTKYGAHAKGHTLRSVDDYAQWTMFRPCKCETTAPQSGQKAVAVIFCRDFDYDQSPGAPRSGLFPPVEPTLGEYLVLRLIAGFEL